MKRNMLNDEVNKFIAAHFNKSNPELSKMILEEFGQTLSSESVRGRKRNLRKHYGDDLSGLDTASLFAVQNGLTKDDWNIAWLKDKPISLMVKNPHVKKAVESLREIFAEHREDLKKYAPKYPKIKRDKNAELLMVLDPADIHIGKLCVKEETGYEYDIEEAVKRVREAVAILLSRAEKHSVKKIVFVVGNDVVHIDDPRRKSSTSGTVQDTAGSIFQMYRAAKDVYVAMIEECMQVADVHVVHCMSNHDWLTGFCLAQDLASWFRHSKNVTFDTTEQHNKYFVYGWNLIMLTHLDGAKPQKLQHLLFKEARAHISSTKFRYIYGHHVHHKDYKTYGIKTKPKEKDEIGATIIYPVNETPEDTVHIETLRSPSPPDGWHHRNGYVSDQAIECFLHHPFMGQCGRFTHYF